MKPELERQHELFLRKTEELRLFHAYLLSRFLTRDALRQTAPYFAILPKRVEGYFPGNFKEYFSQIIHTWKTTQRTQVIGIHGHQGTGKTDLLEKMLLDLRYHQRELSKYSLTVLTAEEALKQAVPAGTSGKYTYLDYQAGSQALTEAAATAVALRHDFIFIEAPANTGIIPGSMDRGTSTMEALGKKSDGLKRYEFDVNTVFLVAGTKRTLATIASRTAEDPTYLDRPMRRPGGRIASLYQADCDLARVMQEVCDIDPTRLPDYDYRAEAMADQLFPLIADRWQVEPKRVFIGETLQRPHPNRYFSMMRRYSFFSQDPQCLDE